MPNTLAFYNTLAREKQAFTPIDERNIRIYACGPTVYDRIHVGNARPLVAFDVLVRLLRYVYGQDRVTYVRNITDVDDKINARAIEEGVDIRVLTERTTRAFHDDCAALHVAPPDQEPRATDHIAEMISMIETLIGKGHAYSAEGHVLFHVASMEDYGSLSRRSRDELIAGARVDVAPYKKDSGDFVLWKPSAPDQPGWDSPWGRGRPGWHIECSAMSAKHLGEEFDIHAGGLDLIFPHHENEIAQSRCAHGTDGMARYWMHNGYVTVEGEKMSKSLGNFTTVEDVLADYPGEAVRFALLAAHYRAPLDFSRQAVAEAKTALDGLYRAIGHAGDDRSEPDEGVMTALGDDLNTPNAIARLHELAREANKGDAAAAARLKASAGLLGLLEADPDAWFRGGDGLDEAAIQKAIEARLNARKERNFAEADRIRDDLANQGILLEDTAEGTVWRRG
jgi:cysteinyl-tRNA synthetase|tara:strand:- start:1254 stop:2609 length:1356 start_codon:yes stop_codon:yes gene_type:complete